MAEAEARPATMREALERVRDAGGGELADALEILVILGGDTDARDLDRDITDFRGE